ncbi:hypothetical protein D3C73_769090 [compost metagenome]
MGLKKTQRKARKRHTGILFRLRFIVLVCVIISLAITGCSSSNKSSDSQALTNETASLSDTKQKAEVAEAKADGGNSNTANSSLSITPAIGSDATDGFNRKLIYKANLVMPVKDYADAQTQLRNLVALSGAYILQFSENVNKSERGGNFTIKVAANGFAPLLDGLEKISPTMQRSVNGQDVTEEYVDLDSRLKAKQAVETRLLGFMEKAVKTDELLAYSNELAKVQEEIEKLKGRIRYIDQNVSYSTIELRMYQKLDFKAWDEEGKPVLGTRLSNALDKSLEVLGVMFQGLLVFMAGALPIVVVILIILIPIIIIRRKRKQKLLDMRGQLREQNSTNTVVSPLTSENNGSKDE